jgi:hypothetical protein
MKRMLRGAAVGELIVRGSGLNAALRLAVVLYCLTLCSCRSTSFDVKPVCATPVPLAGRYDHRAPGYGIGLKGPIQNFWPTLSRWEGAYHIQVTNSWREANMLQAIVSPQDVARLRCEPEVKWIEHNSVILVGAVALPPRDL